MNSYLNGQKDGVEMLLASSMEVFKESNALDYLSDCIVIDYNFDGSVLSVLLSMDFNKVLALPQFVDLRGMIAFSNTGLYSQYLNEKKRIKEYCNMI